jgi:phosphoethanolamine N-methyltransferase
MSSKSLTKQEQEAEDTRRKQDFLDTSQYNPNGIKRYEWLFGTTFLSTGGKDTTEMILAHIHLQPGSQILDVGSGIGGHAFLLAEKFKSFVHGIDLSRNMMAVAEEHLSRRPHLRNQVRFEFADITKEQPGIPDNFYDLIYSRDCFMHIEDKFALFRRLFMKLKPGGRIIFTDYVSGDHDHDHLDQEYVEYLKQRQYFPATIPRYNKILSNSGFVDIQCANWILIFKAALEAELTKLTEGKQEFLSLFTMKDYDDLEQGWKRKLVRIQNDNQGWMFATALKPL